MDTRHEIYSGLTGKHVSRRDCAVRALAVAKGWKYDTAHKKLASAGRVKGDGTHERIMSLALGFSETKVRGHTVRTFSQEYCTGAYVVVVSRHMLAVKDGIVHDWEGVFARPGKGGARRVLCYWKVG